MRTLSLFALLLLCPASSAQVATEVARPSLPGPVPGAVEWRFNEPQPDWKPALPIPGVRFSEEPPGSAPTPGLPLEMAAVARTEDALRVTLSDGSRVARRSWVGGVFVDLPDWRREEWAEVVVRARTTRGVTRMTIGLNPRQGVVPAGGQATFQRAGGGTPILRDGLIHSYRIFPDWGSQRTGPWRRVVLHFEAPEPGSIDILSVRVVPAAADGRIIETTLQPSQLKSDFALFRRALEEAHWSLYHYTTKRNMDAAFAGAEARLTRPMTLLQFRNVLAPVLAAIKGGAEFPPSEFTNVQGDEISTLVNSAKQFPLALTFESRRGFVLLNHGLDEHVKPGMEVLDINGQSLAEILQRILPNLAQDGDIRTYQMRWLGIHFGFFRQGSRPGWTGFGEAYRLYIGDPRSFRTTLRDPRTRKTVVLDLDGATPAEAAVNSERNPVNRDVLAGLRTLRRQGSSSVLYIDGEDTAVLDPRFGGNFPDFVEATFAELKRKGTRNLIVDLRGNTGGFDLYPVLLYSYLTSKDFLVGGESHIKTYRPSFRQYTALGDIDPVTDPYYGSAAGIWQADPSGGWRMTEKYGRQYGSNFVGLVGVQKPAENHFDGTVYILIDGGCISGCTMFSAIASQYKRAIFIGEETGSAADGGSAGGELGPTLPESLLHFDIGMESGFRVVDTINPRRGVLPKYSVTQTIDDLVEGRDTVLELTRALIRRGKGNFLPKPAAAPMVADSDGFGGPWSAVGWEHSHVRWELNNYRVAADSLSFGGLAVTEQRMETDATAATSFIARRLAALITAEATATVYFSVLIRPDGVPGQGPPGVPSGHFGGELLGSSARLFFGKPRGVAPDHYVIEQQGGAGRVSTGVAAVIGQTVFLVVRADLRPGPDVFTLYVNPDPCRAQPASGTVKNDLDLGELRGVGMFSSGAFSFDEFRTGSTFAAVAPCAVPKR
jgi:hypothetical protein